MSRWSSSGSIANYPNYSMYLDGLAPLDSVSSSNPRSITSTASGSSGSFQTQTQTGPPSRPLSSGAYVYGDHGLAGFSDFQYSPAAISSIAESRPSSQVQAAHQSITVPSAISYIAHSHFSAPSSINPNPSFLNSNIPASNDTSPNSVPESSALVYSYPLKVHYPIPGLIPPSLHSQHPPPINATATYPSSVATQSVYDHQNIDMSHPSPAKKQRTRLYDPPKMASSKDFVPPDVSGLSKREARLVKNRAAAYLSRQKKREAFEELEQQVAHLQHENAYLRSLLPNLPDLPPFPVSVFPSSPSSPTSTPAPNDPSTNVETLHAQLASSKQRERSLTAEILSLRAQLHRGATPPSVDEKEKGDIGYDDDDEQDHESSVSPRSSSTSMSTSSSVQTPILNGKMFGSESDGAMSSSRAGTSLGLMALICALPTILKGTTSSSFQSLPAPSPYDPLSPTVTLPVPFPLELSNEDIMMSPVGLPFGGAEELMLSSIIDPELLAYDYDVLKTKKNAVNVDERVGGATGKSCGNEKGDRRTELMVSFSSAAAIASEESDSLELSFEASTGKEGDGEKLMVRLYVPASSRTTTSAASSSSLSSSSSPNLQVSPSLESSSSSSSSPSPSPYLFPDSDKAYAYPILSNPRLGILDPSTLTPEAREHFKTAVLGPFLGAGPSTSSSHSNGRDVGFVPDEFSPLTDNPPSIPHTSSMNFRTRPHQHPMYHSPFSSDSFSVFGHNEDGHDAFGSLSLSPSPSPSSYRKLNGNGNTNANSSKRVRISLVSAPARGVEGGEWRVEVV